MGLRSIHFALFAVGLGVSCGGGDHCVAGTTQVCACSATAMGIQTCGTDGTFGTCSCGPGMDGGPGDAGGVDAGPRDLGAETGPVDASCGASADGDGDGHRSTACGGDDCNDADPNEYPGNPEVCDAAGHDEDCSPATLGPDGDGDGFPATNCCDVQPSGSLLCGGDCDDTRATVNPSAIESCNGVDDNCNGMIDEGVMMQTCYADADGDSYAAAAAASRMACACMPGLETTRAPTGTDIDCDDANSARHPGLSETCDGVDNDCDGVVDNGVLLSCYPDNDMDGYAAAGATPVSMGCTCGVLTTTRAPTGGNADCDDTRPTMHPAAAESCDGLDDDCSSGGGALLVEDVDGDHHTAVGYVGCTTGYPVDDCNDANANVFPGQSMWFSTPIGTSGSYDYNCDGADTLEYTTICPYATSCSGTTPPTCPGSSFCMGWIDTAPACGANVTYMNGMCQDHGDGTCKARFVVVNAACH